MQLRPPASSCSIQIGVSLTDDSPGRGIYAVVEDLESVRGRLLDRGVDVGEIRHKALLADWRG